VKLVTLRREQRKESGKGVLRTISGPDRKTHEGRENYIMRSLNI
jgi:hypothetical protein